MEKDGLDLSKLKKKAKTQLSITVDSDNLEKLKLELKKEKVDIPISSIFNEMLRGLVEKIKEQEEDGDKKI